MTQAPEIESGTDIGKLINDLIVWTMIPLLLPSTSDAPSFFGDDGALFAEFSRRHTPERTLLFLCVNMSLIAVLDTQPMRSKRCHFENQSRYCTRSALKRKYSEISWILDK